MNDMNDMMKDLNDLLEAAKDLPDTKEGEYTQLPDGDYDAVIDNVKFATSKAGKLMFVWEFILIDGEYAKYHEWKYSMLTDDKGMKRLTTDLNKFGVNTNSMPEIENDLELLLDVPVTLTIVSTPDKKNPEIVYRNVSVKPCNS